MMSQSESDSQYADTFLRHNVSLSMIDCKFRSSRMFCTCCQILIIHILRGRPRFLAMSDIFGSSESLCNIKDLAMSVCERLARDPNRLSCLFNIIACKLDVLNCCRTKLLLTLLMNAGWIFSRRRQQEAWNPFSFRISWTFNTTDSRSYRSLLRTMAT